MADITKVMGYASVPVFFRMFLGIKMNLLLVGNLNQCYNN